MRFAVVLLFLHLFLKLSLVKGGSRSSNIFRAFLRFVGSNGGGAQCQLDSDAVEDNLKNYSLWAYRMMDSSARSTFGTLRGNGHHFGNLKECLSTAAPFPTQYCLATLVVSQPEDRNLASSSLFYQLQRPHNQHLKLGLCLPLSCLDLEDQGLEWNILTIQKVTYQTRFEKGSCKKPHPSFSYGVWEVVFCFITVLLLLMVLVGTILDQTQTKDSSLAKFFLAFSIRSNWKNLFGCRKDQAPTDIFHGVRTISMGLIIFGHIMMLISWIPWLNQERLHKISTSRYSLLFRNLNLLVNIFFCMSALLLVSGLVENLEKFPVRPASLITLRYVRLVPVSFYVSTLMIPLARFSLHHQFLLGNSVFFQTRTSVTLDKCLNNWWRNVLFFNNFFLDQADICNVVTWYISCEFQLFIVGVLVVFIMQKNRRTGYATMALLFLMSTIAIFEITMAYEIQPFWTGNNPENNHLFVNVLYTKPFNQGTSYLVGMLGGIVYHKLKSSLKIFSKGVFYAIFCTSALLAFLSFSYLFFFYRNLYLEVLSYAALNNALWTLGVLGLFIAISFGPFQRLKSFLGSPCWIPFSRLSYTCYLGHMVFSSIIIITGEVFHPMATSMVGSIVVCFLASLLFSLFLHLVVEAPFVRISKLLINLNRSKIFTKDKL